MTWLKLSDFDYHLPEERIAQSPAEPRDSAKLLTLCRHSGQIEDKVFRDIADMLTYNDVLVVNETKVINARLKGSILESLSLEKRENSRVSLRSCEIFLHKQISDTTWDCLVYPGKKLKVWAKVVFHWILPPDSPHPNPLPMGEGTSYNNLQPHLLPLGEELWWGQTWEEELLWEQKKIILTATIIWISEKWRIVEFSESGQVFLDIIDMIGETPLPPYIKEKNTDASRYQTVYHDCQKSWSVAAPTAGLHFTPELIKKLQDTWVQIEKVCLHVGLWTFANVEVEDITHHHMHSEQAYISEDVAQRLNTAKKNWKRIIAVGTTSVRTLESFSNKNSQLWHGNIDTEIFIYPGYEWRFVDSIITNFHLPKSTLVMLVSSFAWSENIKKAYRHAIDSEYRFFSYWDAMWIY